MTVSFRFYAQLNDFLSPLRRHRRFRYEVAGPASIKDAIEAIGVPHPEVDLMVVDRTAVDFTYRLRGGDRVSVYPVFRTIDLSGSGRVGVEPVRPVRFVVDIHLGKLASLLRLAGFDAVIVLEDAEAAEMSARDRRVLLTRDVGLLKRALVVTGYWVRQTDPERQFVEVLERYDLAGGMDPFTRCIRCNTPLVPADPSVVAGKVLARTRETFNEFHECHRCGRVYWRGSHYERLLAVLDRVRARVGARTHSSRLTS